MAVRVRMAGLYESYEEYGGVRDDMVVVALL